MKERKGEMAVDANETLLLLANQLTCIVTCSLLGTWDLPSGAKALICGEEPRWHCGEKEEQQN